MDDNPLKEGNNKSVLFETSPEVTPPGAETFSIQAQKDKFLGGGLEKPQPIEDKISSNIREANLRIQREVFTKNLELKKAFERYISPHKTVPIDELRKRLKDYVSLSGQDPAYQSIMAELREALPEEFYVYRGQMENSSVRTLENYSVLPEVADIFAMGEEGYKEGATMVKQSVNRDQIVALGSRRESEVIVEAKTRDLARAA